MTYKTPRQIFWVLAGIAAILNFIWEIGQMPWYVTNQSFWQHLPTCILATIGDVVITLCLYGFIGLIQKDVWWIFRITGFNIAILIIAGGLTAVAIEEVALITHQWQYAPTMPLLPLFEVGLLPILQLMLLPPASIFIARLALKRSYG